MTKLYFATSDALVVLTTEGDHARCGLYLEGNNRCHLPEDLFKQLAGLGHFPGYKLEALPGAQYRIRKGTCQLL